MADLCSVASPVPGPVSLRASHPRRRLYDLPESDSTLGPVSIRLPRGDNAAACSRLAGRPRHGVIGAQFFGQVESAR
jgi:hypothetical protein